MKFGFHCLVVSCFYQDAHKMLHPSWQQHSQANVCFMWPCKEKANKKPVYWPLSSLYSKNTLSRPAGSLKTGLEKQGGCLDKMSPLGAFQAGNVPSRSALFYSALARGFTAGEYHFLFVVVYIWRVFTSRGCLHPPVLPWLRDDASQYLCSSARAAVRLNNASCFPLTTASPHMQHQRHKL